MTTVMQEGEVIATFKFAIDASKWIDALRATLKLHGSNQKVWIDEPHTIREDGMANTDNRVIDEACHNT